MPIGRGKRVLDLGCRSGALTRHFLEGNSVVGLDVDATALEKAKALGIEPVQANVEEPLPFEDASFDAVVVGELLEHLRFPDALVAESRRVLASRRRHRRLRPERISGAEPAALPPRPSARRRSDAPPHVLAGRDAHLLHVFDDVRVDFVGGRYARLSARLFARDLVFRATRPT